MSSSSNTVRLGGIAAVLGGIIFAGKAYLDRNDAPPWTTDVTDMFAFLMPLMFLLGVWGLYILCRDRVGGLGRTGFLLSLVGMATSVVGAIAVTFVDPFWFVFVLGMLVGLIGLALGGIPILRQGLLGSLSFVPLFLGLYGLFALMSGDPANSAFGRTAGVFLWVLFGLGWVLMGLALLSSYSRALHNEPAVR